MNKLESFLKKNSSTILTVVGAAGVIGTSVLSIKATPKALSLKYEAEYSKGEKLTLIETVQVAWKPYIPAMLAGFSTIACIFGANYLSIKNQASLMSAYALLDNTYKEYRNIVKEKYGDDADLNVRQEIVKSKFDDNIVLNEGKTLFFDYQSVRFFESTMERVMYAENAFLENFHHRGYACLNEYYDYLGIDHVDYGYQLGWFDLESNDAYNCKELEFEYEKVMMKNNVECWIINTNIPATNDYII